MPIDNKKMTIKHVKKHATSRTHLSAVALTTETEDLQHARVQVGAHRAETAKLNKCRRHKSYTKPLPSPVAVHVDQVKPTSNFSCLTPGRFNTPKVPAVAEALTPRSNAASSRQQDDGGGLSAAGRVQPQCAGQAENLRPEKKGEKRGHFSQGCQLFGTLFGSCRNFLSRKLSTFRCEKTQTNGEESVAFICLSL